MPVRITSLSPHTAFSEICETLVVNVHGAGLRSPAALPIATAIRLETADRRTTTGWITDFEPIGQDAKWWLLGIALEQPANFWGVPHPPDNWVGHLSPVEPPPPQYAERKFSVWPGAYGTQQGASAEGSPVAAVATMAAPTLSVVPPPSPRQTSDSAQLLSRLQADLEERTEEHWRRLRSELEPQLLASSRGLQQELQDSLAAWRAERTAAEGKLQELLALRDEVSARLASITSMLREQSAPLREEIISEARTQVNRLISEFQEHLGGERQAANTAQQSLANALEEQIRTKADTLLQQLRDRSAEEIAARAAGAMDKVERQLQAGLEKAGGTFQHEFLQELEQRQQAASQAIAAHLEELRASEAAWRDRVHQLQGDLSMQSEQAMAQLRVQVQELGDKQEQELSERRKKRDAASEAALQTVGGRMLASAREQLQAEVERQQQQLAASSASLRSELERMERHAAELESRLTEVRQAREYVESLAKALPDTIEQRISERVAAAIEQMSGPAQQQFTGHVQSQLTALERRVQEVAEQVGTSLSGDLAADAAARNQQWQSSLTAGLSTLQTQAAAIRDEAARIGQTMAEQQQAFLESANARLRELTEREGGLQQTIQSLTGTLDGKKDEVLAAIQSSLEQLRAGETRLHDTADQTNEAVAALTQESLASLKTSLQAMVSEREQQLQQLLAQSQKQADDLLRQQQQAFVESANAKLQELAESGSGLQQTFQSLTGSLEGKKDEVLAAIQSSLEQVWAGETRLHDTADQTNAAVAALTQESLASLKASLQAMASEREQQLQQLLAQSQKQADDLLRQQAANAAAAVQEQIRIQFEERRKQFEEAQSSAVRQLETLQQRAEHLTSLVDVELQQHADALLEESMADAERRLQAASEAVREAHLEKAEAEMAAILEAKLQQDADALVARAVAAGGEQLQAATAAMHRDQLARAQAELDRLLSGVVQQAADAGSELRQTIAVLQQELAKTKLDRADIRREVEQAQTLLAQQTAQFQATLHDAFLQAAAEIRGRIHQAVEMAEEPLGRRGRDIQSQLTAAAQHVTEELQKQFAEARDRLQVAAVASESHAEQALQERLAHAMEAFRKDAESLARRSMERWQTAVNETLSEIPQLLGKKLGVDQH